MKIVVLQRLDLDLPVMYPTSFITMSLFLEKKVMSWERVLQTNFIGVESDGEFRVLRCRSGITDISISRRRFNKIVYRYGDKEDQDRYLTWRLAPWYRLLLTLDEYVS